MFVLTICVLASFADIGLADVRVELLTRERTFVGKSVAHDQQLCWLTDEAGRLTPVRLKDVTEFRRQHKPFQPQSAIDMREAIRAELGRNMEVTIRGNFVVGAAPGTSQIYAEILEKMSRSFSKYAAVRQLPVTGVEYPLAVIVYPKWQSFSDVAIQDKVNVTSSLRGYYHPHTNRVALFDTSGGDLKSDNGDPVLSQETVATLVHEGIHQLAFNRGLHSRIGQNPRWIVEGFATLLEADAEWNAALSGKSGTVNQQRLFRFQDYRAKRREETIAESIADDEKFFQRNVLDAYSQAWAVNYFLAEEYPSEYANFLRTVALRDPLDAEYSNEERLADFQRAFPGDLAWLEVRFGRFFDSLK